MVNGELRSKMIIIPYKISNSWKVIIILCCSIAILWYECISDSWCFFLYATDLINYKIRPSPKVWCLSRHHLLLFAWNQMKNTFLMLYISHLCMGFAGPSPPAENLLYDIAVRSVQRIGKKEMLEKTGAVFRCSRPKSALIVCPSAVRQCSFIFNVIQLRFSNYCIQ